MEIKHFYSPENRFIHSKLLFFRKYVSDVVLMLIERTRDLLRLCACKHDSCQKHQINLLETTDDFDFISSESFMKSPTMPTSDQKENPKNFSQIQIVVYPIQLIQSNEPQYDSTAIESNSTDECTRFEHMKRTIDSRRHSACCTQTSTGELVPPNISIYSVAWVFFGRYIQQRLCMHEQ